MPIGAADARAVCPYEIALIRILIHHHSFKATLSEDGFTAPLDVVLNEMTVCVWLK